MKHRSDRPIIGVTGPDRGGAAAWIFTRFAVWLAGGRALRITPGQPCDIEHVDGLIIGGGADVDPQLYGQELLHLIEEKRPEQPLIEWILGLVLLPLTWLLRKLTATWASPCAARDPLRDALEMRLIHAAVVRRLPILGICRGCQLLNVHFGGSLYQSIKGFYVEDPEVRSILPRKRITVPPDAKLTNIVGGRPQRVNALHRQAIHELGRGLRVAACDRNGIVQAIEHETLPFVLGVQWHPEYLPQVREQRALFKMLVKDARARMDRHVSNRAPAVAA
jgi:putative glutamine amidotransferase